MMDITTIAPYLIGAGILLFGPIVLVVLGSFRCCLKAKVALSS